MDFGKSSKVKENNWNGIRKIEENWGGKKKRRRIIIEIIDIKVIRGRKKNWRGESLKRIIGKITWIIKVIARVSVITIINLRRVIKETLEILKC
jgi:hypothetical protein